MPVAVRTKKVALKPADPQADPRFKGVREKVGQKAVQLKKHPPAKKKADEAAKAAKGPPNQLMAGAKEKQTDLMKGTKPEKVQPDSFKALLLAEIEKVMPEKLDDADKFMEGGKEQQMKGAVSGKVGEQKGEAEKDIKTTAKAPPNQAGIKPKEVENIPPDPKTPVPTVNAAEGMPVPRTNAEISQEQSKRDADQQMKDAQITTPQMQKANDPRFTAVLDAKKECETVADQSPDKYRAKEKAMLAQTNAKAQGDARRNLTAFVTVKTKSGAAVKSRQDAAKAKDEKARKEVADNIEAMYTETKTKVEGHLATMETDVLSMFDAGAAAAIEEMKSNSKREIEDFKDDRYSGIRGKARWFRDLFRDTPQGIIDIINKNMVLFKATMNRLVDRVAAMVDQRLKMAKDEIDRGQLKIKNYVNGLKGSLKDVGKAAEKEVAGRFEEMRAGVDERKNALAQKLAESYKAAIDKGNAIASELEAENAGAAYRLAKKIAEIARLILDFKDKLLAILKKAVSVILDILSDPIGFFGNLVAALKQGFGQFKDNFAKNFKEAVAGWLLGSLGGVGFELPKDLSAGSIIKLVMGIAGLTYERLRAKAATKLGERNVAILEKLYEYVKLLVTAGPEELWAKLKEDVGDLQDRVIGEIKSWLTMALVEAGIKKLLMMAVPGAGFVQAAIAIYKLIVFIIERASQIAQFISSVVDSVSDMVAGNISAAANRIERALVQALSLIFDLLARLVGLSGIADQIKSIIKKVQDVVGKAIDKVLDKIVATFKKMGTAVVQAGVPKDPNERLRLATQAAVAAARRLTGRVTKTLLTPILGGIKMRYGLKQLEPYEEGGVWWVLAEINPKRKESLMVPASMVNPADVANTRGPSGGVLDLYRGIHFRDLKFNYDLLEGQALIDQLVKEEDFSEAVYSILGTRRMDSPAKTTRAERLEAAQLVAEEVQAVEDISGLRPWWTSTKIPNLFLTILQRFLNSRTKLQKELSEGRLEHLSGFSFTDIPFISTTKSAARAAKYAMGTVVATGKKTRQRAKKKVMGKIFVYLVRGDDLVQLRAIDIRFMASQDSLAPHARYSKADAEITFPGRIPEGHRVGEVVVRSGEAAGTVAGRAEEIARTAAAGQGGLIKWS